MSAKPVILLDSPMLGPLKAMLAAEYEVLALWEHPDRAAFLAGPGQAVQVIIGGGGRMDPDLLDALPRLGLIARIGSGYEGVDVPRARARGVEVTHTPGVNAEDVADHAVALLLAAVRGVVAGDARVRAGGWTPEQRGPVHASLKGYRVGVVGLGDIGRAVAARMAGFRSEIRWWGPRPKPEAAWVRVDSLADLAAWCDALVICARADASDDGLIDGAVLDAVGPHGVVVNISRGSILDEDALIARLRDGRLGGAALDVFAVEPTPADRWRDVPNTVLTPHTAGHTRGAIPAMVGLALENVRAYLEGRPPPSPVPR